MPIVFHNGSTNDYHFIIKQLAKQFYGQLQCLGENTGKYITFSVPIIKELDNNKTITYKLKLIVLDLCQPHYQVLLITYLKFISKVCKERRKIKSICNFIGLKNDKFNYECKKCKKRLLKPINELIQKFPNVYKFCNGDTNKFVLLLRKGVYPNEHMDSWEGFNETLLSDKNAFYSELYLEDITDEDYTHAQKVFEEFNLKNLGDYQDLYVQNDTLLFADVFENIRNKCIEIYELDPANFLSAPGLAW